MKPSRGDIWLVNLDPTQGREQAGTRPVVVVSVDAFNHGPAELVLVVPLTTRPRAIPSHVPIHPPEAGLRQSSYAKCEDLRSISSTRLHQHWGRVSPATLAAIELRLRFLLGL